MTHSIHEAHDHVHGANCGHVSVQHAGHVDYLHDGHLHNIHGDHVDEHTIAVDASSVLKKKRPCSSGPTQMTSSP